METSEIAKIGMDLTAEFTKLASDMLQWGQNLAHRKHEEVEAKQARDILAAELDARARDALAGDKKPTEAAIAAWVKVHPDMQNAEAALAEAAFQVDDTRAMVEALHAKKEMLILLGGK